MIPDSTIPAPAVRPAADDDVESLVALYDGAARWMRRNGIDQWKPGDKDTAHFRLRIKEGEVWIAETGGRPVGAYELWWEDLPAWGIQAPVAGYVHRLMTDRATAPCGLGRVLLAHAEQRIADAGREFVRLDCLSGNSRLRAYYEAVGYRVVGEEPGKVAKDGSLYAVTLLEKPAAAAAGGAPAVSPVSSSAGAPPARAAGITPA
ncbi:GNAT family N-acetyltransferase [Streptomyces sp. NBC_01142]|uniref:GNAT family N-acetyltransferase n=1 Tax=Streptomyces sp. NBC_01142 TaxID=2975865 RepID=UPI002253675C|nr:GNAT family N-acetyltransferase [Streptomyces sp. NBC_01142]MCX4822624.1 GNAT family N-acetyltransferase [Streptomyces sp. NBC_01142]